MYLNFDCSYFLCLVYTVCINKKALLRKSYSAEVFSTEMVGWDQWIKSNRRKLNKYDNICWCMENTHLCGWCLSQTGSRWLQYQLCRTNWLSVNKYDHNTIKIALYGSNCISMLLWTNLWLYNATVQDNDHEKLSQALDVHLSALPTLSLIIISLFY